MTEYHKTNYYTSTKGIFGKQGRDDYRTVYQKHVEDLNNPPFGASCEFQDKSAPVSTLSVHTFNLTGHHSGLVTESDPNVIPTWQLKKRDDLNNDILTTTSRNQYLNYNIDNNFKNTNLNQSMNLFSNTFAMSNQSKNEKRPMTASSSHRNIDAGTTKSESDRKGTVQFKLPSTSSRPSTTGGMMNNQRANEYDTSDSNRNSVNLRSSLKVSTNNNDINNNTLSPKPNHTYLEDYKHEKEYEQHMLDLDNIPMIHRRRKDVGTTWGDKLPDQNILISGGGINYRTLSYNVMNSFDNPHENVLFLNDYKTYCQLHHSDPMMFTKNMNTTATSSSSSSLLPSMLKNTSSKNTSFFSNKVSGAANKIPVSPVAKVGYVQTVGSSTSRSGLPGKKNKNKYVARIDSNIHEMK